MSHEESPASSSSNAIFSAQECAALRESDLQAAKSIVLLMCGVFTAGLLMYLFIALTL